MIPYPYTAEGRQPAVLAVSILFFLLTPGIVALRLCSRVFSGVGLWWDDWIVLLSLVGLTISENYLGKLDTDFNASAISVSLQ